MNVYLAGPMRGYPEFNFQAFDKGASYLRSHGHKVFNPAENDRQKNYNGETDLRSCMYDDLTYIMWSAEVIALLPGWNESKGVKVELALANYLGLKIWYITESNLNGRNEQV